MMLLLIQMSTRGYKEAQARWKRYGNAYSPQNQKLFRQAGEVISEEAISQNFEAEGRPEKWKERKYTYSWPILYKTGKMRARLERTALEWIHQGRKHINRIYGPYYSIFPHKGTKRLPARLVVQFSQQTRDKLMDFHKRIFQQRF